MNKKVYFAGSIRGGRQDAELYKRIIAAINETDTVLTEHVGDLSLSLVESQGDKAIYEQDTAWLRECDLVIAECSTPSLGVGYELAYAEKYHKPVYIFYKKGVHLSAMLTGDDYFEICPYEDEDNLLGAIGYILGRKWFITEAERQIIGYTCYMEFQHGWYQEAEYWREDSLNISINDWERADMTQFMRELVPGFDDYDNNIIDRETWNRIKITAEAKGGDIKSIIDEVSTWCEQNFERQDVFYIFGV